MGIFSRLFKSGPPRDQWGRISLDIAKGLEEGRDVWFGLCIKVLTSASGEYHQGEDKIRIRRNTLYGNGLRALKAYQLYLVSKSLAQQAYIKPYEGKDFADILYAQVCGLDLGKCLIYWNRYHEIDNNRGAQLFRFTNDIASHITGDPVPPKDPPPLIESMIIGEIFPLFYLSVCIVVANGFGDLQTVSALNKKLSEIQ